VIHTYVLRDSSGNFCSSFRGNYVVENLPNISIYDGLTLVAALILQPGQFVVRLEDPKPKLDPSLVARNDHSTFKSATGLPDYSTYIDMCPKSDPVDANAAPRQERTSGCKYHTSPDVQAPQQPAKVKKNPTEFRLRPLEIFKYKAFTDSQREQVFAVGQEERQRSVAQTVSTFLQSRSRRRIHHGIPRCRVDGSNSTSGVR
jgi:hypothetical protein